MPTTNAAGLDLIRTYEGVRLRAYPDPGTGGDPWTIGYGHTAAVHPGQTCTIEQAAAFLVTDVRDAEKAVSACITVELNPNQFSALVSFQYNTGSLPGSTLMRCVNEKAFAAAALQFGRWIFADGQELPGLVTRRAAEAKLFGTPA